MIEDQYLMVTRQLEHYGDQKNLPLPSLSTFQPHALSRFTLSLFYLEENPSAFEDGRIAGHALFVISRWCKNPRNSSTLFPRWNSMKETWFTIRETHPFDSHPLGDHKILDIQEGMVRKESWRWTLQF